MFPGSIYISEFSEEFRGNFGNTKKNFKNRLAASIGFKLGRNETEEIKKH